MKDYLKTYGTKVNKFQAGGEMPAAPEAQGQTPVAAPAEAPAQGQDLQAALMQAYQSQDPQAALAVVNMIVEQMQASQGGAGQVPAAKNGMRFSTPVFRKGGTLKA